MRRILAVAAAAGAILTAAPLWADSAAPTGNAADFFTDPGTGQPIACPFPGPLPPASTTPCFDPNASGTKLVGTLAVVYAKTGNCVTNVFVNLTVQQGNALVPFTTDYLGGVRLHGNFPSGDGCADPGDNQAEQVKTIVDLIRIKVIPIFFSCGGPGQPSCPSFQVKTISNFVSTTGPLSSATSDGFSADVTIAVH